MTVSALPLNILTAPQSLPLHQVYKLPLRQAQGFIENLQIKLGMNNQTTKCNNTNAVYQTLDAHFPNAEIVIPPKDKTFTYEVHPR